MQDTPIVILAGGQGTRLKHIIPGRPKALAEIHDRPFLHYLLEDLACQGFRHVILCTGIMGDQIRQSIGTCFGPLEITYSHETKALGTGGAIHKARSLIASDQFIVMNGDSYSRVSLSDFFDFSIKRLAAMVLTSVEDTARYGGVQIDSCNRIVSFQEKQIQGPGLVNSGIYWFTQKSLTMIHFNQSEISLEHDILPKLVEQGIYGYVNRGDFIDIGTEASYRDAESFFSSNEKAF